MGSKYDNDLDGDFNMNTSDEIEFLKASIDTQRIVIGELNIRLNRLEAQQMQSMNIIKTIMEHEQRTMEKMKEMQEVTRETLILVKSIKILPEFK